jgi:hypothetical protein
MIHVASTLPSAPSRGIPKLYSAADSRWGAWAEMYRFHVTNSVRGNTRITQEHTNESNLKQTQRRQERSKDPNNHNDLEPLPCILNDLPKTVHLSPAYRLAHH